MSCHLGGSTWEVPPGRFHLGGSDSNHQEQPDQEESTHSSNAGEANEGSCTEGKMEAALRLEEANMQDVARSSNVTTAPCHGFEGDNEHASTDKLALPWHGFDARSCSLGIQ